MHREDAQVFKALDGFMCWEWCSIHAVLNTNRWFIEADIFSVLELKYSKRLKSLFIFISFSLSHTLLICFSIKWLCGKQSHMKYEIS